MQIISKKSVVTLVGLTSIFLAIGINGVLSANQQKTPPPKAQPQYPVVSVTEVTPVNHQASVTAFGEVKSRNQLSLTSQVSGQVTYLSPKFLSGNTFKKGELLAQIEPIVYQQALADAKAGLADAKLALAQEELNSLQSAQEWQQSGLAGEQPSDLVLRKPQLEAALAKYQLAVKAVEKAEYDLAQTKLTAPFDALLVSRQVQVGSNVQAGTSLAELYDISLFEVSLPLTQQHWQLLPSSHVDNQQMSVKLLDEASFGQWTARVDRFEQHIDGTSRQRALVAVVEQPIEQDQPLFPGAFVKASIQGQMMSNLWQLPASSLIDNQTVWQVNDAGLLQHLPVKVMFSQDDSVFVQPLDATEQARIVNRPLSSYLVNMKVSAKVEESI